MKLKVSLSIIALLFVIVTLACGSPKPAEVALPDLPAYNAVQLKDVQGHFANIVEFATEKARPDIALAVSVLDATTQCYQEQGAVQIQAYSAKQDMLSSGVVVIVDHNRLTDPKLLAQCSLAAMTDGFTDIEPCANSYTFIKGDNKFYIAYVGTTPNVCQDFCSNLEGCK